jgi:D-alanyl-D-alanine carboxypeptidase
MKKVVTLFIVFGLLFLGLRAFGFFPTHGKKTSLESSQINASADSSIEADLLILVNRDTKLPDDYKVNLTRIGDVKVASVLVNDLREMENAAERDNVDLFIGSAYRSTAEQQQIFDKATSDYNAGGKNSDHLISSLAASPGYSEHETGLAIDFSLDNNTKAQSEMWEWLRKNAYKYGFILRYAEDTTPITGYEYEPWHYRYVGRDNAKAIYERGVTLEEYLGKATKQNFDEQGVQDRPPSLHAPGL